MRLPPAYVIAAATLLSAACGGATDEGDANAPELTAAPADAPPALPTPAALAAADTLHTWVDGLSLRTAPEPSATRVGRAGPADVLRPTGQIGGEVTPVVLRGGLYETPWIEVSLPDGTTGYAFAGALRRPLDAPGPAAAREGVIDVEHFGRFDLSRWRATPSAPLDAPEVDGTVTRYRAAARELEVTETDMGEMHYGITHRLVGDDGTVFREHRFSWNAGADGNELTEEVIVREGIRPRRYARTQTAATHYYDLPKRPTRVVGPWREERLEQAGADAPPPSPEFPSRAPRPADGEYRSLDDPRAGIVILNRRFGHSYDGVADAMHAYRLADACPPEAADVPNIDAAPGELLVVDEPDGPVCYLLMEVTPGYIEMGHLGGAGGAPLRYERVAEEGI